MGFEDDPGQERRHHDQEALDEIRRLFAHKREAVRNVRVTEHDEPPDPLASVRRSYEYLRRLDV